MRTCERIFYHAFIHSIPSHRSTLLPPTSHALLLLLLLDTGRPGSLTQDAPMASEPAELTRSRTRSHSARISSSSATCCLRMPVSATLALCRSPALRASLATESVFARRSNEFETCRSLRRDASTSSAFPSRTFAVPSLISLGSFVRRSPRSRAMRASNTDGASFFVKALSSTLQLSSRLVKLDTRHARGCVTRRRKRTPPRRAAL